MGEQVRDGRPNLLSKFIFPNYVSGSFICSNINHAWMWQKTDSSGLGAKTNASEQQAVANCPTNQSNTSDRYWRSRGEVRMLHRTCKWKQDENEGLWAAIKVACWMKQTTPLAGHDGQWCGSIIWTLIKV